MDDPPSSSSSSCYPSCSAIQRRPKGRTSLYTGDFGEYFSEQYCVLKLILSYLDYYDLNTLRQVNSTLKLAADALLKKRLWIHSASLNYLPGGDGRPEHVPRKRFVDLKIEPKVLFTFEGMPGSPCTRSKPKICMRLKNRYDIRFFPKKEIVPDSIKTFVPIGANGLIYPQKNDNNELVHVRTMQHKKLVLLYLPTKDNYDVDVYTHLLMNNKCELLNPDRIRTYFLSDSRPVKGIIFLKIDRTSVHEVVKFIVKFIASIQSQPFAVSGGQVASLEYSPHVSISAVIKAVIFRGEGVRCMSDIIDSNTNEQVLEELKEPALYVEKTFGNLDVNNTFIFMFQCTNRYSMQVEDYKLLSTTYPGIPIFGMQTWTEFGFRSFKHSEMLRYFLVKEQIPMVHLIKTTYMLITFV